MIGVIVFTGLAAYDTQTIKETYAENAGVEANSKLAVFGALSLYLSFINLFQMLLQLFGVCARGVADQHCRIGLAAERLPGRLLFMASWSSSPWSATPSSLSASFHALPVA